jgi:EmrB/QacA subfamily drug resistance transporter
VETVLEKGRAAPEARRWLALALLCVVHLMVVVDVSIVNVALPSVAGELGFSESGLQWVVGAYTLTFGGFLLLGGRAADLFGRRRVLAFGLLLFAGASLLGGLALSAETLVAARALQGVGGAIALPAALSVVATTFEGPERNRAFGAWSAVGGAGFAVGVLAGGLITEALDWRWVFLINIPVGFAAVALLPLLIPGDRVNRAPGRNPGQGAWASLRTFDAPGALTVTAGLVALVYAMANIGDAGWASPGTIGASALALALLGAFVVIESRASSPLVPLSVFRLRTLAGANGVALVVGAVSYAAFYFVSLHLQGVLGYSPLATGLAFLPLALAVVVAANVAPPLVTKSGPGAVLAGGLALMAASFLWLGLVAGTPDSSLAEILFPSALAGLALGFSFVPLTAAAVGGAPPGQAGLASGLVNTSRQVGGALGLALLVAVASAASAASPEALAAGYRAAFLAGAGLSLIGLVLTLVLVRGSAPGSQGSAGAHAHHGHGHGH